MKLEKNKKQKNLFKIHPFESIITHSESEFASNKCALSDKIDKPILMSILNGAKFKSFLRCFVVVLK